MKLITYTYQNETKLGAVDGDRVVDLSAIVPDMLSLICLGHEGLVAAEALLATAVATLPLTAVKLEPPIPNPIRNIMCLGLNYVEHAAESYTAQGKQITIPTVPIVFTKATTSINGPYDEIPYDANISTAIDWEAELAVVIGKAGRNITAEQALDHVFGYMVLNDATARDLQRQGKQYFKGKSLDGHCPTGPWLITKEDVADPHNLTIRSKVNGVVKQESNTRHMIFNIPAILAYLSAGMTLLPGDIIATGTPSGVGFARTPPEFLQPGDVVECEVEGVGMIRNKIQPIGTE